MFHTSKAMCGSAQHSSFIQRIVEKVPVLNPNLLALEQMDHIMDTVGYLDQAQSS